MTSPALVALRVDIENLAALLHILTRGATDEDMRRTLQLAARAAEAVAAQIETLAEENPCPR